MPASILTFTGIAVRWVTGGYVAVPYWLLLGLLGTALLGFGMLLLFQREAWDRLRHRIARWWIEAPPAEPGGPHSPAEEEA
ncbi:MAG: hypothetical protein ACKVT1_01405 [Dehalococcoidia bacterium]